MRADLFCQVIDNLGDIGVMWRLARQLASEKQWEIRLWVDKIESLAQIQPDIHPSRPQQFWQTIDVRRWPEPWQHTAPCEIAIAGFSCPLPNDYLAALSKRRSTVWIQLEYLSAQEWVGSFHAKSSQRNDGLRPVFFFPGFTSDTGGLIRETGLIDQRVLWQQDQDKQKEWLRALGVNTTPDQRLVSVFTYPHAPIHRLIEQLQASGKKYHLLIPTGVTSLQPVCADTNVSWQTIPFLTQPDYDRLLWSCDLNLVRGEDSFVRAIWAAKPLLWQIYPQQDGVHHQKLDAWLARTTLPTSVGQAMHEWADGQLDVDMTNSLVGEGWGNWQRSSQSLCHELSNQTDLAGNLDAYCRDHNCSQYMPGHV